jgi:hypothetical protein
VCLSLSLFAMDKQAELHPHRCPLPSAILRPSRPCPHVSRTEPQPSSRLWAIAAHRCCWSVQLWAANARGRKAIGRLRHGSPLSRCAQAGASHGVASRHQLSSTLPDLS